MEALKRRPLSGRCPHALSIWANLRQRLLAGRQGLMPDESDGQMRVSLYNSYSWNCFNSNLPVLWMKRKKKGEMGLQDI